MELLGESAQIRAEAEHLLAASRLLEIIEPFGRTHVQGAFAYDAMLDPDIDIHIAAREPGWTTARKLHEALADQAWWNAYSLQDWTKVRRDFLPAAHYVGVKTDFRDRRWKVDMWVLSEQQATESGNGWIEAGMTPAFRDVILQLKDARRRRAIDDIRSYLIYDAVLRHGVRTVEGLSDYLRTHPNQRHPAHGRLTP